MGSFLATLFIEGWAFYCEELLEQTGYIAQPVQRLGRLSDQLWRAARIILDASLHTKGMPLQEAVDFLVKECKLEPADALAEARRYTSTPTQPQCYLMGKLALVGSGGRLSRLPIPTFRCGSCTMLSWAVAP